MNRKKAGMIAAAVMLPVAAIAGSVAFFFTYAVVRMEKKKKKKKRKKAPAAPKEGEGLTFGCFRDKMEEGTRWFKEQDPEKITLTSYDGLKPVSYTHLDVYKRQPIYSIRRSPSRDFLSPKSHKPHTHLHKMPLIPEL